MKVVNALSPSDSIERISDPARPTILTLGNYDGIHLGHKKVIQRVAAIAKKTGAEPAVLTFLNHPAEVLRSMPPLKKIVSLHHKMRLMRGLGIETLVLLEFTKELAQLTPSAFLSRVNETIPFSHLILGYDAAFGKNREGTPEVIRQIATTMPFEVEYIEPYLVQGTPISSSRVRTHLQNGDLAEVEMLLGRPYSILSHVQVGQGKGKKIGFPTANFAVSGLCLPPFGVYSVSATINGNHYNGIANLGLAPTLRQHPDPVLEVHFFNFEENLYDQEIEVEFKRFIRPEQKFESVEALRVQIACDILRAEHFNP